MRADLEEGREALVCAGVGQSGVSCLRASAAREGRVGDAQRVESSAFFFWGWFCEEREWGQLVATAGPGSRAGRGEFERRTSVMMAYGARISSRIASFEAMVRVLER